MHIDYYRQLKHMLIGTYTDGTMYTIWPCIIFILKIIFFSLGEIISESCLSYSHGYEMSLFKKCFSIFFLYLNCIVQPAFWPFSSFNVNNSETDEYWNKALPILSVRNLLTPELASIGICFWLIFT